MNKTDFVYPRDGYPDRVREFYASIDGADAAEPPRVVQGENWHCHSSVSRGEALEKAGCSMLHIVDGRIYDSPGSIKFFETLAYPANPRVPGFVFLMNVNRTKATGTSVVLYTDIFFQDGAPNPGAAEAFVAPLRDVYTRHGREFSSRYKGEPGRILAGLGAECGIMDFFREEDAEPFLDEVLRAALPGYRAVLAATADTRARDEDFAALHRHRARLVEWLTVEDIGIRFARESGVPLEVIEAYGYPPVVRY